MSVVVDFYEHLADRIEPNDLQNNFWIDIAGMMECTAWIVDDAEEGALLAMCEQWLDSDDIRRVGIAVHFEGICPIKDTPRVIPVMSRIAARWPGLASACNHWIEFAKDLDERTSRQDRKRSRR